MRLQMEGYGQKGPNDLPNGHLIVHVEVRNDPRFVRDGNDIHVESEVRIDQAALGGTIRWVPSPSPSACSPLGATLLTPEPPVTCVCQPKAAAWRARLSCLCDAMQALIPGGPSAEPSTSDD